MRYITIQTIILFTFCCLSGYSQSPSFVNNLNFSTSFVCYGGQMTVNASAANADTYQFQIRNETTNLWENVGGASGTISASPAAISHTFFGIQENITTRVIISKNTESVTSNEITISPQRPTFNFQPLDITQCNGLDAIFRISASGTGSLTYQWQLNSGGVFQNISNGSEYSGTTSSSMTVLNLANNENGKVFRCIVKDANNCENYSNLASLNVNQLSSVVSPLPSSNIFCEGDLATFSVDVNSGNTPVYQWLIRRTTDINFNNITESTHFEGVNTPILKVNGILPSENSYRLNTIFTNLSQNSDGTRGSGTCSKTATRINYIVNQRPAAPVQIDDVFRCSTGKVSASVVSTNKIFWYTDSTAMPFINDNLNFTSPTLSATTKFFYSLKDINGCESYKRTIQAVIRPRPSQDFPKSISICPTENNFQLDFSNVNNLPIEVYVQKGTPALPNFSDIDAATFSNNYEATLPNNLSSGDYQFKVFTKNQHCFSDTSLVDLKVKIATKILNGPTAATACEGTNHTFEVQYTAENPVSFKWYKDDLLLPSETSSSLLIENLEMANQGQYKVEVIGDCGAEMSENVLLTVLPKIEITKQPIQTIVCQNGNTKLEVEATGTGTLNYEWTKNGEIIGINSPELILENIPLTFNNSLIKCKISSDCEPDTYTNEVLLIVDALPVAPLASATQGFCKSITQGNLIATALADHSLHWFDENQVELTSNQIDISTIFTKTFFVSQKNSNLCESPKTTIQASTNEPFEIDIVSDKAGLCSSGLFNRTGVINTSVTPAGTTGIAFELFKDAVKIDNNLTGEFEINGGGIYQVLATKDFCSTSSSISIELLHPELTNLPTVQALHEICKNTDIKLEAGGLFAAGNYAWYSTENTPFQSSLGAEYALNNVSNNQTWFVAYGITTSDIYCETPRAASQINLKPDLEISAEIVNVSCAELQDGQITYAISNGTSPFSFTQNGISNATGIFSNLSTGSFTVQVSDANGCVGEKTVSVNLNPGINITQQPNNISRCRTNIANFTLAATNYDQIIWERKLPNSSAFETIAGENLPNLRVENIGNTANPHLTIYRAKLTKGMCAIYTQEATLFVNSITGTGSSKTVCENSSAFFDLNEYTIVGANKTYQWQYRLGSTGSFTDISNENTESISLSNVQTTNAGFYRCRITFDNGGGNTCVINTSTSGTRLMIETPEIPLLSGEKTICIGQNTQLTTANCSGVLTWSDGQTGLNIVVSPTITTTYTANCVKGSCTRTSINAVTITVNESPLNSPTLSVTKTKFCNGENIIISASNCTGNVIWSNELTGENIEISATESFSISAHCISQNCQSPESETLNIIVNPILTAGEIVSNSSRNCLGFNPLTINSVASPNGENIQWQKSENCSSASPLWTDISGEIGLTYNPPALLTSTCFRRMVSDSCQTVYSNSTFFEIVPDPVISIFGDKTEVCFGQKLTLNKTVVGGEGICDIQWQINKVSGAVSSSFWRNLSISEVLEFTNSNTGNDSTFYFRARIDCQNSSCNLSTSNVVSAVFFPELAINTNFSDSTVCSGSTINLVSSGCKGQILWSTGEITAQISVTPTTNTVYIVSCKNSCDEVSKNINISVVPGISAPTLLVSKTKFCNGETIIISASNCTGNVIWSNGLTGENIEISATESFSISAHCNSQNCQSPESETLNIIVNPILTAGEIVSNSSTNCSGFNPLTINSVASPNGENIQWQKSENCTAASPLWTHISNENGLTYNPPALLVSTCFRRMVSDSCQTVYSNSTFFEIVPDPVISIFGDKIEVCFGQKLTLNKTVVGGEGICDIQWQINKVSAAVSSSFWRNLSISEVQEFTNSNAGNDSTFYFRARIDCQNSSCNLSTSNAVSAVFLSELAINTNFSDSTVCSGSTINLVSTGCKGQILWSTGEITAQISVTPTTNTVYIVSCKNSCDEVSKNINISVVPGISAPTLLVSKTTFCNGETIRISANNCTGNINWSNGLTGENIEISATESFSISAHCISQNCQSPESQIINIIVYPILTPGEIISNSSRNCSGFNPLTINSISDPNGGNIQWQKSENCSAANPLWTDISGETGITYNPPALLTSTCFRRMVSDSCQTLYSNSTLFEIVPDPVISITGDKTEVCFGQKLTINKTVVGGEGICDIQWQINKVSGAVSSSFWKNLIISEVLEFTNSNTGNDSTFYFRARIDCQNSSCNLSTSNAVSAVFLSELAINTNFSDSTVCSGSTINLVSTGCKGQILWSTGEITAQISVTPTANTDYIVSCKNSCDEVSKNINISVVPGISAPTLLVSKTTFCNGETIRISASNCTGNVIWSNGLTGENIEISATESFSISAHCISQNCQSPESETLNITVYPILTAGEITSISSRNCSGFNPLTINSISDPNGGNIQWQKSENCSAVNPLWTDITGETGLTYNPPALLTSTCFRRMVSDSCQTVYSNSSFFEIVPDPVISITGDKTEVCFGQKLTLNKTVVGGEGICDIQWQINKVSAAVSSSFWRNLSISEVLEFSNSNIGNDSTFYFRARIDCQNSSCNLSTSNAVSAVFLSELAINTNFSDSTVCSGSTINLVSSGCKGQILWSTGEITAQISVTPTTNTVYIVSCKNSCDEVSKNINISVVPGISAPTLLVSKTKFCNGETIIISASNCTGNVIWSNELTGENIEISATESFSISAHCNSQNFQSPESETLNITVYPILTAGEIMSNSSKNCSGFNPLTINSVASPNGGNIQWQKSENCSAANPLWTDISSETGITYNPPALLTSTCFRRMVSDSCQTVYSNSSFFEIVPDPVISIFGDKNEVCFGQKLTLNKTVVGGEGICDIQWQINKISGAVTSSFWRNLSISDVLEFSNSNIGNDSTFYFRARIDCQNSSCNLSTSNVVSAVFLPELAINTNFSDSTVCSGSTINLVSSGCKGQILWSTGATTAQISVAPTENTVYTVSCKNICDEVSENINISVVSGILAPTLSVSKTKFCNGETIMIPASNCTGNVIWSNGLTGENIEISATESFSISAHCISENCQSPESETLNIIVNPVLTAGEIVSNSSRNCSGFNPLTINSVASPNGGNIQWQKSENCSAASPLWTDISGEIGLTYNPPALLTSTCFRRMVSDSCQTVYSNSTLFDIVPDPIISITGDKTEVCFGQKLTLNKAVVGGEGICDIQWQINKVSAAVSSSFWRNLSISDVLEFTNSNAGNDSTFYFRARIDCRNSSCNLNTSNVLSAVFLPELAINTNFSDSTVCSGSTINLVSSGCKGQILWSTGEITAQISVTPTTNTVYTVSCKNSCGEISKNINISVVPGISAPLNTTMESVLSPEILVFSAIGQNLKWFDSETTTTPLANSPQITTPGEYSFWVTQTIGICESPRLKITAKLNAELTFVSQPTNTTNCYGNTSTIGLEANGSGTIFYKWQRKKPNEETFTDIGNEQTNLSDNDTNKLIIRSLGNNESPNLTRFRCIIWDDFSEKISDEIVIIVNRLQGNLPNQKLCLGTDFVLNLNQTHQITGNPTQINWQQRSGTGDLWQNLNDSANISGSKTLTLQIQNLNINNQKQYRCSIQFASSTGTCTETTDLMSLSVGSFPENPKDIGFEFCQNVTSPKLELYEPSNLDVIWYLPGSNIGLSKQPIIDTKIAGNQIYFYSFKNAGDCESARATVQIIIQPEPPKPINTTPSQITEGQILIFTAFGEQLKWFTSRTGRTFSTTAPSHQKVGTYDYYVSQTSLKGCESERTYIESEIVAAFGIATQPINQANCDNNTSTFSIKTKGAENVTYRWQMYKNGIFEDIVGENSSSFRIDDVGKSPNIDGSRYRCIASNSVSEIISNEVTLNVNQILGKLNDMAFCEFQDMNIASFKENLKGNISQIDWQNNLSGSFSTIFSSKNIDENIKLNPGNSGDYRLRITFQNQGSSTCVRTSNNFKIEVHPQPKILTKTDYSVCQYSTFTSFLKELPDNFVLRNMDSTIVQFENFASDEYYDFIGNYTNDKGCSSEFQNLKVGILEAPKFENSDISYNYCQFTEEFKSLQINNLNTFWYKSEEDDEPTENGFTITTEENQKIQLWAAIEGNNTCLSQKRKVEITINPCYFDLKNDTCFSQSGRTLNANNWNYFYDASGKIFAAVHPNGQNLGAARMDFKNTSAKSLKDKNQTPLYPRYFNLFTSNQPNVPIKIRFYFKNNEIIDFGSKVTENVAILNYNGKNLDCELENNILENNYWLETIASWQQEKEPDMYFVEFNTIKTGEFGLWNSQAPMGILTGEINASKIPQLNISERSTAGTYQILKSKDGKTWFDWLSNVTKSEFTDLKPFLSDNYYQLIYNYGNGIKAIRNTVKLTVSEDKVSCVILENPSENRDFLKLYFPNIDKSTIRLNTAMGQSIDVNKITEQGDYFEIYPNTQLSAGFYTLKAQNVSGKNCSVKVWIR